MANKTYRYSYKINLKFIFPDDSKLTVNLINAITKHFNYAINFFPIFECDCLVPINYMTKIRTHQDCLYTILTIIKEKRCVSNTNDSLPKVESEEEILNHAFVPFFTKDSFNNFINEEAEYGENNSQASTSNVARTLPAHLKFAMYSTTGLSANKKLLNYVAGNKGMETDVGTMIKYLLSKTDIEGYIIDKPDNEDTYENLIVTPHNLNGALKELQVRYGIYRNGLSVFYDPPVLYILDKFSTTHDYIKDKPNKLILNMYMSNPSNKIGVSPVIENADKSLSYLVTGAPSPLNEDMSMSELLGNEVIFSNITLTSNMMTYKDGKISEFSYPTTSIQSDIVNHKMTGNKRVIDYDDTNNPYNYTALLKAANLGSLVTIPRIIGIDFDSIKPNSSVTISIKDDNKRDLEFSGVYSVIAGSIVFSKSTPDDNVFMSSIEGLTLSKMTK